MSAEDKARSEQGVFARCAAAAGLPVVEGSIDSRRPPEPDIVCQIEGEGLVAFELVDLVDQPVHPVVARSLTEPGGEHGTWYGDPTLERIRGKLDKSPHPVELLAYGDDTLIRDVWLSRNESRLRDMFDAFPSPFRRVWVVNLGQRAGDPVWLVHPAR